MGTQTIVTPSGDRLIVLPEAEYEALVEAAENVEDANAFAVFQRRLQAGEEELVPSHVVDRILAGDNRVKVWREYRGMTANALAHQAEIAQGFLSQIETGKREGTADTLLKIAAVLRVSINDLVEQKNVRVERLIHRHPGLTVPAIAKEVHASESHVRKCCDWLCKVGRAIGRGRPTRFYPPEA